MLVNPFRDFGFYEVRVLPGDLDADMIDSTDVLLHYEHSGSWSRDKLITVRPGGAEQSWKLRLSDPERREFSYKLVHRLNDGSTRETERISSTIPSITVNDPFEEPLFIELYPNYDPTPIRPSIVDITYDDPTWPSQRVQQVKFQPNDIDSKRVRFARGLYGKRVFDSDNDPRRRQLGAAIAPCAARSNGCIPGRTHGTRNLFKEYAMNDKSSESSAKRTEGKSYGLQRPQESAPDTSGLQAQKQKIVDAVGDFIDAFLATTGAGASGGGSGSGLGTGTGDTTPPPSDTGVGTGSPGGTGSTNTYTGTGEQPHGEAAQQQSQPQTEALGVRFD